MPRFSLSVISFLLIFKALVSIAAHADEERTFPESHKLFTFASSLGGPSSVGTFGVPISGHDSGWPGPPPQVGANTQVNDPQNFPFGRSETTIAVSGSGRHMVVGWNDGQGFCGPPFPFPLPCTIETPGFAGYAYSSNGGESFIDGGVPPLGHRVGFGPGPGDVSETGEYLVVGDPALDVGGLLNKTFYYVNLAEFVDQHHIFFGPDPTAGVVVHKGRFDRRGSFEWTDAVLLQSPNYPRDFLDKEFIATDKRLRSNALYVSVTNEIEVAGIPWFGFGQIEVYASPNGGRDWSRSIVQPDETVDVLEDIGVINQGSQPAVDRHGKVYVAWERGWLSPLFGQGAMGVHPQIRVAVSDDGGASWWPAAAGPPSSGVNPAGVLVSEICSGSLYPPVGFNRPTSNDFPRIAVARTGRERGRIYVVWQDCRIANGGTQAQTGGFGHPDTDIYLAHSDDHGRTWSDPILVAGNGDGKIQFWPTVSLQRNGNVDITYYESVETDLDPANDEECIVFGAGGIGPPLRVAPVSSLVNLFYVQSTDGGSTFGAPVRVSELTSNWCNAVSQIVPNFGDYNTAVSVGNRVYSTWADGRNGVPDVFFAKIRTSSAKRRR